jgi:hypothetical protein
MPLTLVMAGLVPAISLREAYALLNEITGSRRAQAFACTRRPGDDKGKEVPAGVGGDVYFPR